MIKRIKLKEWKQGTGSRASGIEFRNYLLVKGVDNECVEIDFVDISVISSGFADEVFGRLFVQYGPVKFAKYLNLLSVNPTINSLIDKAITERIKVVYKC